MGEQKRGCGYRKIGGLYLVSDGQMTTCAALPIPLEPCRHCGHQIEYFRGFKIMDSHQLLQSMDCGYCPLEKMFRCGIKKTQQENETVGVKFIGSQHYTPQSFTAEALKMGVSLRVSALPKKLEIGKTWVFIGHPKAIVKKVPDEYEFLSYSYPVVKTIHHEPEELPGLIYAFRPKAIELIVTDKMKSEDWVQDYEKKGVELVEVPDIDRHQPTPTKKTKRGEFLQEKTEKVTGKKLFKNAIKWITK